MSDEEGTEIDFDALLESIITPAQLDAERAAGELFKTWEIRNLSHAYQEREPLLFLVDSLLPCPSLSIVYGGPGSLKSMILCDMAICVASGQRWLDAMSLPAANVKPGVTFAVKQAPVLWIDFDNGTRRTDERVDAFARARSLPVDTPFHYVSMPRPQLDASNPTMIDELVKLVKYLEARLVIVDNLGLISGDTEENNAQMAQVMGNLRWLCDSSESAVIVIHHQRKSAASGNGDIRKGESLRGHSSIEASLDLALLVERKPGEDSIAIVPTKVRGYQAFDVFGAYFTYEHRANTHDLETARFYSQKMETKEERELTAIRERIINEIKTNGDQMKQSELVQAVRDAMAAQPNGRAPGINKVRGTLKNMVSDGILVQTGNQRNGFQYQLP